MNQITSKTKYELLAKLGYIYQILWFKKWFIQELRKYMVENHSANEKLRDDPNAH